MEQLFSYLIQRKLTTNIPSKLNNTDNVALTPDPVLAQLSFKFSLSIPAAAILTDLFSSELV